MKINAPKIKKTEALEKKLREITKREIPAAISNCMVEYNKEE